MKRTVSDVVKLIGRQNCIVIGRVHREFRGPAPIGDAVEGDFSFCTKIGNEALQLLKATKASVILCDLDVKSKKLKFDNKTLVIVENPRLWFIRSMRSFVPPRTRTGIHPTAVVGKNCKIGKKVYIGPNVSIADDVEIGNGTKVHSGVQIHDRVRIGKNVVLKSGCVIGSDGFGYERNDQGILERFPHVGGVIIEDNVEVGANTCVDRGTLSDTIIGEGTKIDNLVHVGHNAAIGKHCVITALAMIPRSKIGDGAWIAPTASMLEGTVIGKKSLVGMGAVVTKNVPDGDVVVGVPAKSIKEAKK